MGLVHILRRLTWPNRHKNYFYVRKVCSYLTKVLTICRVTGKINFVPLIFNHPATPQRFIAIKKATLRPMISRQKGTFNVAGGTIMISPHKFIYAVEITHIKPNLIPPGNQYAHVLMSLQPY